jgi:hypothetical protein
MKLIKELKVAPAELLVFVLVVIVAFLWSLHLSTLLPAAIYTRYDVWFGADIPRVVANMTDVTSDHFRTKVHPLFSFLILPSTKIASALPGVDGQAAVGVTISLTSALLAGLVYVLVRSLTGTITFGLLATGLLLSSASYVYWSGVPETYVFGSAAIAAVFLGVFVLQVPPRGHVLLQVFALAFTTTNWVAGLLASFARFRWPVAVAISGAAVMVTAIVAVWQKALIPSSGVFFLPSAVTEEPAYVLLPSIANLVPYGQRALNFVFAAMVAPAPILSDTGVLHSTLQFSIAGWIGAIGWGVLFVAGGIRLFQTEQRRELLLVVGGFLAFQFLLHLIYGDEPFLYSLHFLPALVLIAALSLTGRHGRVMVVVMGLCILCNLANNYTRLQEAAGLLPSLQDPVQ